MTYVPGPKTPYELTAARLRGHLKRDADQLDDGDRDTLDRAIYLMECLDRARALGVSMDIVRMSPTTSKD
jgi:hypothetical protein